MQLATTSTRTVNETALFGNYRGFQGVGGRSISRRAYFGLIGSLTLLGFAVMGVMATFTTSGAFQAWMDANPVLSVGVMIGSIGVAIVAAVLEAVGSSRARAGKSGALGLLAAGYVALILSFGVAVSMILPQYGIQSIAYAFTGTACVGAAMTGLGVAFPTFFQRIAGVILASFAGVAIAAVVCFVFGLSAGILDWALLGVFSLLIGVTVQRSTRTEATLGNAIFWATNLYADLVNVLLTLLRIFGEKK